MTSSTSSSSRRAWLVAGALVATACAAQHGAVRAESPPAGAPRRTADLPEERPAEGRSSRIALLPPENLSGRDVNGDELIARMEGALIAAGLDVVSGGEIDRFLAKWRIRSTGGLDTETAAAVRTELGADAILVTSIVQREDGDPPRLALLVRLVSTEEEPTIYWMDGLWRTGEDHPGLLQLGLVHHLGVLETEEFRKLSRRLVAYLEGNGGRAKPCSGGRRYRPRISFQNFSPPADRVSTVAVLPFVNRSAREGAGEVVALEMLRELAVSTGLRILDPAVVRAEMLSHRVIVQEGVSTDTARLALGILQVDYVLAGTVLRYDEARGGSGEPQVEFMVTMLEARTGQVAWQSSSGARGSDGVFLFDFGYVRNTEEITCRLAREVAKGIAGAGKRRAARIAAPDARTNANSAHLQDFK